MLPPVTRRFLFSLLRFSAAGLLTASNALPKVPCIVKDLRPIHYPYMASSFEILLAPAKSSKNRLNFGKPVLSIDADFPQRDSRERVGSSAGA
jgi:hypothetical protein